MSDLVRKEIYGIFENKNPTKEESRKYKRYGKEWFDYDFYIYVQSDYISRMITNCRSEEKRGEKNR